MVGEVVEIRWVLWQHEPDVPVTILLMEAITPLDSLNVELLESSPIPSLDSLTHRIEIFLNETAEIFGVSRSENSADFLKAYDLIELVLGQLPVSALRGVVQYVIALADLFHQACHSRLDLRQLLEG